MDELKLVPAQEGVDQWAEMRLKSGVRMYFSWIDGAFFDLTIKVAKRHG